MSATECTASTGIDDDPLIRHPMNFATVIPALASNAAVITVVPNILPTGAELVRRKIRRRLACSAQDDQLGGAG
ncbi:MAG: hypothetical protein ACRDRI_13935 [Pseudonocardiaceae bacterium]